MAALLKSLHWLQVEFRITYTICKALTTVHSSCLSCFLQSLGPLAPELTLFTTFFSIPMCNSVENATRNIFECFTPRLWNSLPLDLKMCYSHKILCDLDRKLIHSCSLSRTKYKLHANNCRAIIIMIITYPLRL